MKKEPLIHSHIEDCLPEDHKFSHETIYCTDCERMVHASWVETGKGNYCVPCFSMLSEVDGLDDDYMIEPTQDQIKEMVDRFLCWKLPKDFSPDAGISFNPTKPYEGDEFGNSWWPIGTNLLYAGQAEEMIRFILGISNKDKDNQK